MLQPIKARQTMSSESFDALLHKLHVYDLTYGAEHPNGPKWHHIVDPAEFSENDRSKAKFHNKDIPKMNPERAARLPMSEESWRKMKLVMPWILADARNPYAPCANAPDEIKRMPKCHMEPEHVDEFAATGKIRFVSAEEELRRPTLGVVHTFEVWEEHKNRTRAIGHTITVNGCVIPTMKVRLPSAAERDAVVAGGDVYSLQLDASSWYDQIPVYPTASQHMRFRDRLGRLCEYICMPMGATISVETAHTIMEAMTDCCDSTGNVSIHVYIDNVRFVGKDKEEVLAAARVFMDRCNYVGVTMNEAKTRHDIVDEMAVQHDTFLGHEYDYAAGKVRVGEKAMKKIGLLWGVRERWSFRKLAGHYSLLFHASSILQLPLGEYFNALRVLRNHHALLQDHPELWDMTAPPISGLALQQLTKWTAKVRVNAWRTISTEPYVPTKIIVTDASGSGWGAICWNGATFKTAFGRWQPGSKEYLHSSYAEPEAVFRGLAAFVANAEEAKSVVVFTDHIALTTSVALGRSRSYIVNDVVNRIHARFGPVHVRFVPGSRNPADGISRDDVFTSNQGYDFLWWAHANHALVGGILGSVPPPAYPHHLSEHPSEHFGSTPAGFV